MDKEKNFMASASHDAVSLLDRPYAEGQRIMVVDDAIAEAERHALQLQAQSAEVGTSDINWRTFGIEVAKALVGVVAFPLAAALEAVETAKTTGRLAERGVDVLLVRRSEAADLMFPVGHPRERALYVGHPAIPNIYYTAALFHRLTFEHKFSEAVRMLMSLGVTEFEVEHVTGWSDEFATTISGAAPVPLGGPGMVSAEARAEAGRSRTSASNILFKATLSGNASPTLPENLVWYPHEPTWQQIAEGRLTYGLQDFALTIRYEDDYGVNAGLKLAVAQVGLDLGGTFEDHQSTIWRILGTFGSPPPPR